MNTNTRSYIRSKTIMCYVYRFLDNVLQKNVTGRVKPDTGSKLVL